MEVNSLGEDPDMRNLEEEEVLRMDDKHTGVVAAVGFRVSRCILGWWRNRYAGRLGAPLE